MGALGDELGALIGKDQSLIEQKALEDLIVTVEVKLDGNTRAIQSSQDFIEDLAETVLDDDIEMPVSDFTIVTQKNERISSGEIRLQTSLKVETKDNSVSHTSAWVEMGMYFDQITQGDLLEK